VLVGIATVTRRFAEPADDDWLRELFAQSRPDLAMLPSDARATLLELQFRAQHQQYAASYPDARHEILVVDGVDVGRLILDRGPHSIRVVDVIVMESCRGRGIASTVLREVIQDAEREQMSVRLAVWSNNLDARRLYERLGFVIVGDGDGDGYLDMIRNIASEGGRR
jgi:ribosomal protein S18 acetylase RimI-like enzyme